MELSRRSLLSAVVAGGLGLVGARHLSPAVASTPKPPRLAQPSSGTLRLGIPSRPMSTDPSVVSDHDSLRLTRQVYDTLVAITPDTGEPTARLALEWDRSADHLRYDFTLRDDVEFHDGTPLTAEIVAQNFQRWATLPERLDEAGISTRPRLAFAIVFGGYTGETECLYDSSEAVDDTHFRLQLHQPISGLVSALTDPSFAITCPEDWPVFDQELSRLNADPEATEIIWPMVPLSGTGSFTWPENIDSDATSVTLTRTETAVSNPDIPTEEQVTEVHAVVVTSVHQRLYGLESDQLDAFDGVAPAVLRPLVQNGFQVIQRDPMSTVYVGFNQQHPVVSSLQVRQAVAHAIDSQDLVNETMLSGSMVADHFLPPAIMQAPEDIQSYPFDVAKAQELLDSSAYQGQELEFWYPIEVGRPYLPNPEAVYAKISEDLATIGLVLKPVPVPWEDYYLQQVLSSNSNRAFHLLGAHAVTRDPLRMLARLFGPPNPEFGWENPMVAQTLRTARSELDSSARDRQLARISRAAALDLPAFPLAFPISSLASGSRVQYYPISPVLDEHFDHLRLSP
ncbi:hypothetical protein DCC26_08000 [Auritidibacter sp. NML120779]|nr:hypothetical protein DCC26_08000 [Auritidibacter sp. NML120779]